MRHKSKRLLGATLISAISFLGGTPCSGQEPLVVFDTVGAGSSDCSDIPAYRCGPVGVVFGFQAAHPLPIQNPYDTFTGIGFQVDGILDVNGIQTAQVSPGGLPPTIGAGMLSFVSAMPGDELTQESFLYGALDTVPIGQEFYLGISSSVPPFGETPSLGFGTFFVDEDLQLSALSSIIFYGTTDSIIVGVPEPSSLMLLVLATSVTCLLRRKRYLGEGD